MTAKEVMDNKFTRIFKQQGADAARAKYLSRLFGVFSEQIVRIWAADPRSPYEDLGRPTLRLKGEPRGSTLDFTFAHRTTGKIYVVEMKCEIEYQDFKYLVLTDPSQLLHHKKPAFDAFLSVAAQDPQVQVFLKNNQIDVAGAILIWGAATPEGRQLVQTQHKLAAILTVADIVQDLQTWQNEQYRELLLQRKIWATELFDGLLHDNHP